MVVDRRQRDELAIGVDGAGDVTNYAQLLVRLQPAEHRVQRLEVTVVLVPGVVAAGRREGSNPLRVPRGTSGAVGGALGNEENAAHVPAVEDERIDVRR
eukprot:2547445-Prymnesium_polylepis.1